MSELAGGRGSAQDPARFGIGRLFWITSEAIVATDLESGLIVLWNPAAARLFGYPAEEALGMPLERLVPDELHDQHLAGVRRYRQTASPVLVGGPPIDIPARTKDGKALDVALTLADVSDSPSPRYVLAVIRDMTDVRRAERELQRALEALREFVATASHDLRTPLMSVLGFARSLLQSEHQLSEEQRREFLEAILRGATHASRLVDDLLTLSQIQAGVLPSHPQETAVASAVMEAVLRCGVDATFQIDDDLAVLVDPHQLERILVNYLTNAARHGEPPISVTAEREGTMVAIGVHDSGQGVPDEFVPRLFTTFARDDTVTTAGTGLGLSIVKGLAQANGGDAYYEPSASGTCFGVRLPVASPLTSAGQL